MNPTLRRLGKTGQWRWAPIATLTSSSLVRTRAQLERRAHSMKSPTDLLFTRDGTFAGLRGRNLSPRRQWRPSLPQETVLRGRLCESDFACDCAASSTSRGRAGRVSRKSRYSQQRRKVYTIGLTILVAVSSSLVRGRPHHPSSGNAKSYARAIAAG
jgi:hypothetical protein